MVALTLPAFPDDVPVAPLHVIDYTRLKAGDEHEIESLWAAATEIGFWYLKNHGADEEVNAMFDLGAKTLGLPLEEKMKFEQGDWLSYKHAGAYAADATGATDSVEFLNVSKDDALAYPEMDDVLRPFVRKSMEVNETLIGILNDCLGLPRGALAARHSLEEHSGSEARCIKAPRLQNVSSDRVTLGAHTDFGSLSFLHNRLGGLQVLPPGMDEWKYVRPIPGHAVCNLGDAMAIFSGGILRSNLHRIMSPPKAQAAYDRWSIVYFTRPGNSIVLEPLSDQSALIAEAVSKASEGKYNTGVTAGEWFQRRVSNVRIKNRKGPETWYQGRGTEHNIIV
ncbi:Clavaminate synthase-like protein [Multifurca ochricompacta]|uniref:Clavaminate synthase-like protein n=1 Tax=Multifurca ochricompacta TaxID=376703 RepID=A0AAD4M5I7_9AGAM|nr:Clavaminate synthase-like protein [Multifurca ochricompacta]